MSDASGQSAIDLPSSPPPPQRLRRKRTRLAFTHEDSTPSDPPLFSSDPADPSVEHYFEPRRKKQYRGTWWGPEADVGQSNESESQKARAEFVRNIDSGIFMGSDGTEENLLSDDVAAESFPFAVDGLPRTARTVPYANVSWTSSEGMARRIVHQCLDNESEVVDLSDLQLQSISDDLLVPLHSLIKQPRFLDGEGSPRDEEYHPLQASLQLFLSSNSFRTLPPELFNLQNLTVLSLRNNHLASISPHISKLNNLVELNIAGNVIRWLPWELLSLIGSTKLRTLTVLPNPLLRPFSYEGFLRDAVPTSQWQQIRSKVTLEAQIRDEEAKFSKLETLMRDSKKDRQLSADNDHLSKELEQRRWMLVLYQGYLQAMEQVLEVIRTRNGGALFFSEERGSVSGPDDNLWTRPRVEDLALQAYAPQDHLHHPIFIASTPIFRFEIDGSPSLRGREKPPSQTSADAAILAATPGGYPLSTIDHCVPSLFELAAFSAGTVVQLPELHTLLPEDAPTPVIEALQTACQVRDEGGRLCSVCGRSYIMPRTEWIEYWHIPPKFGQNHSREEMFWPFLRRGCTPGCVSERGL